MAGLVLVTVNPASGRRKSSTCSTQSRSAGIVRRRRAFRGNPMLATVEEVRPHCPELREVIRFDQWDDFLATARASSHGDLPQPNPPTRS